MSRFPERRRIEKAIETKDERELRWALGYCQSRLSSSTMRQHEKHWRSLLDRVRETMEVRLLTEFLPEGHPEITPDEIAGMMFEEDESC